MTISTAAFISSVVRATNGATPYTEAEIDLVVRRLVEHSASVGVPLTRESVLARDNIGRFIAEGLTGRAIATRADYRSKLLRTAEALLPPELAPRALAPLAPSDPTAPYDHHELNALGQWARRQKSGRREDAKTLLALGLGAGLSASELMNARSEDIILGANHATFIQVREGRRRTVPVRRGWERQVAKRSAELDPSDFLFLPGRTGAGKNLVSNWVKRADCTVHVTTQRLRSTWLVSQMAAHIPLPELVDAAGVDSLEALTRYLQFVPRLAAEDAARALRAA